MAAQYTEAAHQENLKAIEQYENLLRTMDVEGDQKAELMFRLIEKYFEEGRYEHNIEMQRYQEEYDNCFNTPDCDVTTITADTTNSEKWQKKPFDCTQPFWIHIHSMPELMKFYSSGKCICGNQTTRQGCSSICPINTTI